MKNLLNLGLSILLSFFLFKSSSAQTIEMGPVPDSVSTLGLDYFKLMIADNEFSAFSGIYNLAYKHVVNQKINLIGELNYGHFKEDGRDAENNFGNVFLGAQIKTNSKENVMASGNVGVYLPTGGEEGYLGSLLNIYDLAKYPESAFGLSLGYTSFHYLANGLRLGYEFESVFVAPKDEENELLGKYGVSIQYELSPGFYAQSELLGVAVITEDGDFDERTFHTYSLGLGYYGNQFGVAVSYKNFFDDLFSDDFNGIFGVQLFTFLN